MKKTIFVFLIFLLLIPQVYSQKKFRFGLQISPGLSWFKPETKYYKKYKNRFAFQYGLVGDFNFADNYGLSTGLLINNYGGGLEYPYYLDSIKIDTTILHNLTGKNQTNYKLTYIELPVYLKMKTNEIGYMTYFGKFGFNISYNWKYKVDNSFISDNSSQEIKTDDVFPVNPIRIALDLGLGFEYNLSGNTNFILGLTYSNGFISFLSTSKKNRGFEVDDTGKVKLDNNKQPNRSVKHSVNAHYIALNLGVFF